MLARVAGRLARSPRGILLLIAALGLLITALHRGPLYAGGDRPDYLARAYHLYHDEHAVEHEVRTAILQRPLTHLATTIRFSIAASGAMNSPLSACRFFFLAIAAAVRERNFLILTLLSAGAFNLVFYAAFSLNIPRYQMTALPSIAIGAGYMATRSRTVARLRAGLYSETL